MSVLEETKGKIKLEGKIVGIKNEKAFREGFTKKNKEYKSISFFVQTSKENRVKVELFGMVRDEVIAYSQTDKKTKRIPWAKREDDFGSYKVMGTSIDLKHKGEGFGKVVLPEFDAVEHILANLAEGDSVRVIGELATNNYENDEGVVKESVQFPIKSITVLADEIDFEADDFKEVAMFEQEVIITDVTADKETKKLIVSAKLIAYKGSSHSDITFAVDASEYPKLANNMAKRMKFGDFIKVFGLVVNKTIITEEVVEDDGEDWGGDEEIQSEMSTDYIRDFISELQITSVKTSTYEPKKYTEDDFIDENEDAFNGNTDEEEDDDFDEDDLGDTPFS